MILRTTHKPPVQSLLIIRLKTSTFETKMETVGALPAPDVILPTTIIHLFGIVSENGFGAIEAEELLAMDTPCCHQGAHCECFRYWAASSVVDVVDDSSQYAVAIAGHYFRTINYVFCVWKKRTTANSLW